MLQRTLDMRYIIETTKTDAGTRVLPITEDVAQMFQAIIEDRNAPKVEKTIDGYSGFLFYDDNGMPLVAMHWQHRFNHMVGRYNDIYRVQMPNITPHVCRHTYCSNMAKSGMNPKTLQYLMGHSDISVTMNVYTHIGFDDAEEELKRIPDIETGTKPIAFGDFSYYWIVGRKPVTVRTLLEKFVLYDQIGYLAFEFLDGKLVRNEAIKVIQMADAGK